MVCLLKIECSSFHSYLACSLSWWFSRLFIIFSFSVFCEFIGLSERVADIKTRAHAMKCLTTFSEAVGPGFIFERVSFAV